MNGSWINAWWAGHIYPRGDRAEREDLRPLCFLVSGSGPVDPLEHITPRMVDRKPSLQLTAPGGRARLEQGQIQTTVHDPWPRSAAQWRVDAEIGAQTSGRFGSRVPRVAKAAYASA